MLINALLLHSHFMVPKLKYSLLYNPYRVTRDCIYCVKTIQFLPYPDIKCKNIYVITSDVITWLHGKHFEIKAH